MCWNVKHEPGPARLQNLERMPRISQNAPQGQPTQTEQQKLLQDNFMYMGRSLIETGIAWFWPDAKIQNKLDVYDYRCNLKTNRITGVINNGY